MSFEEVLPQETESLKNAQLIMHELHDGVRYGGGLVMSDQVQGTVDKIKKFYKGENIEAILTAAYLHKAMDVKHIDSDVLKDGKSPYDCIKIKEKFGSKVAEIVSDLASEPSDEKTDIRFNRTELEAAVVSWRVRNPEWLNDDLTNKQFEWMTLADWAKGLSKEAQVILLAEKLQNFEVSRDKPNMNKSLKWHEEYYQTRMFMCEAIQNASPELYKQCQLVQEEGLKKLKAMEAEIKTKGISEKGRAF